MAAWRALSAFYDYLDLQNRCEQLTALSKDIHATPDVDWVPHIDFVRALRGALDRQHEKMAEAVEAARPGLWPRTYIAGRMYRLDDVLASIESAPRTLPDETAYLIGEMHAALIWAHEVFNPRALKALVNSAVKAALREHNKAAAKATRPNRTADPGAAAGLVAQVRKEKKTPKWNVAWSWLCEQVENRQSVGDFYPCELVDGKVIYTHSTNPEKRRPISSNTFRDRWNAPASKKKAPRLTG